jgi:precorrin-3B synthase
MTAPEIKGWCPGALRPMQSGDGLLVRIRPPGGRLTARQATGIARASLAYGNGVIDLSSRANVQLRGVRDGAHEALVDDLRALGLVDDSIAAEAARNIVVTPFAKTGAQGTANLLAQKLAHSPALPGKFGFTVDIGPSPVLGAVSADVRLERDTAGGLIVRPDGHGFGKPVTPHTAVTEALALAAWFLTSGGAPGGRGRMARHLAQGAVLPAGFDRSPAAAQPPPGPGRLEHGWLVGFAFGQMQAETLAALVSTQRAIRVTPWRMLIVEGLADLPGLPGLITTPDEPLLHVTACTGVPGCLQAFGDTRRLARTLAPGIPQGNHLHISGCTKGCAHPGAAALTLVATLRGYDLIRGGTASDAPHLTGLPPHLIADALKDPDAPSL